MRNAHLFPESKQHHDAHCWCMNDTSKTELEAQLDQILDDCTESDYVYDGEGEVYTEWFEKDKAWRELKALIAQREQAAERRGAHTELRQFRAIWHTYLRKEVHEDLNERIEATKPEKEKV